MEEFIFIILILLTILTTFCIYKILDKRGLYFSLVIMNLLSYILSFKIAYVFKMNINLNIIALIEIMTILYIINAKYGKKENKNIIIILLITSIIISCSLAVLNFFTPAITETVSINMQATFEHNYKIIIFYPLITLLSELAVIKLSQILLSINKNIFICIVLTYIITGLIYTLIFCILSYISTLILYNSIFIGISTYIIGIPITLINLILVQSIINKKVKKWEM